jgi:alkyl sulfatase BDS1-like metallo-beta-lactamase superfamily hydrolase
MKFIILATIALIAGYFGFFSRESKPPAYSGGGMSAEAHQALKAAHDWSDPPAFADAARGLIAVPKGQVKDANGRVLWDFDSFSFLQGDAPVTAHPGLWRQAKLNNHIGLFKVTEGIWQLRGFDLANISLIQGKTGWIVVDPLTTRETAAYAMDFARKHLGNQPVSAIIYTHSHVDHYGGALGIISVEEAAARKLPIVAPAGFLEEATSEAIMAGVAMGRRAMYQFARDVPRNPEGTIDGGLGKAVAFGNLGIIPPSVVVDKPVQELSIDGVRFVFQNVPGTEAPSEFTFSIPDLKAFCGAEMLTHTLHNVMTPRGAKVRDALHWAHYMDASLNDVKGADVFFASHHWPVWGQDRIRQFIIAQRDVMKYLHDQTVRMFNSGMNGEEIADRIGLPPELDKFLHTHGYYGSVKHNVRAIFQFYISSFDGNPANLDALPRTEIGKRLVQLAGGADKAVATAQAAFDKGDLRWAAQLLDWVLRAEPKNEGARALLMKTYRQLGFASESAIWRNFYLQGAHELMAGPPVKGISRADAVDMLKYTPVERFLEAMAASINGPKAAGLALKVNLVFSDTKEAYLLTLANSVMWHAKIAEPAKDANATLTLTKPFFLNMMTGAAGAADLLTSSETKITGSAIDLGRFFGLIEKLPGTFPIVPAKG